MGVFSTLLVNGLANGALYFLMASGLTLIFGLMRVVNFAHGGLYLWGAYGATFFYTATHQFWISILAGAVVAALLGWVMEKGLVAPVYRDDTGQLLMTMGIMLVLSELVKVPFGVNAISSAVPTALNHSWLSGHFVLIEYQFFILAAGAIVYLILKGILKKTRLGVMIRAGVGNPELVQARGIAIRRVFTGVFVIGAGLAGLAGAVAGPYFGSISPTMGFDMQLNAFIIVVVGGIGSLDGALVGSLLIGVATAFVSYSYSSFAVLVNVVVMAVVLILRPQGLFGKSGVSA